MVTLSIRLFYSKTQKQVFNLFSVIKPPKKRKKKKIQISPAFAETDFYKSSKHSRSTIFGIIYAARNFIKVGTHQPHCEDFMPYLHTLIEENPVWASDTGVDDMKWQEIVSIAKARWRRYKNVKTDFGTTVGLLRTICDSYFDFEK